MNKILGFTYSINGVIPVDVEASFKKEDGDWVIEEITASTDDGMDIYGELREVWERPYFGKTTLVSVAELIRDKAVEEAG